MMKLYITPDLSVCFEMITERAARLMRFEDYGIEVGKAADLVVWGGERSRERDRKMRVPACWFQARPQDIQA